MSVWCISINFSFSSPGSIGLRKEIIIFPPGDGEKEVFKDVEFQSNPEAGLLAIFKNDGKESFMFSGHSFKIEMAEKDAKELCEARIQEISNIIIFKNINGWFF